MPSRTRIAAGFAVALAVTLATVARADPLALWHIVGQCVTDEKTTGNPAPCMAVLADGGTDGGAAILKDRRGASQYLLIPIERVTGIEDPKILAPDAPNYFAIAWKYTALVSDRVGHQLPRDMLSLAINAQSARSQEQLHIHIDCVRADVAEQLRRLAPGIGPTWARLPEQLAGNHYEAMRIDGADLGRSNPFALLADQEPGAATDMGAHTLVLVGASFGDGQPGFILLDGQADLLHGDIGAGETLQDHACAAHPGDTK